MNDPFSRRLQALRLLMQQSGVDAYLVESPIDLFYLTGLELSAGQLFVGLSVAWLIVDGRYSEKASSQSLYPVVAQSPQALRECSVQARAAQLGFDQDTTSYSRFLALTKECATAACSLTPLSSLTRILRRIKDAGEIEALRAAARLDVKGCRFVQSRLVEGVLEEEIACELDHFWKQRGARGTSFDPIIAFGAHSSMPHYRAGSGRLKRGDLVLIDIGVLYNAYHSDLTRVVRYGSVDARLDAIYQIVAEAQHKAIERCVPGTKIGELDAIARGWIAERGYGKQFSHSLGHGVGLEIHEWPSIRQGGPASDEPLRPGMVITIEPGIYIPGLGGVRLEDTVCITDSGYEILTCTSDREE